jgi:outer membrane immunogenic protein
VERGTTSGAAGVLLGLQGGYNWQHSNFVYGLEGDISWIGSNTASSNSSFGSGYVGTFASSSASSRVNALATFRARFGIDFNGTLPYLTAGFALGHIRNTFLMTAYSGGGVNNPPTLAGISGESWVPGVVVGGGIEHQLTRQWALRGEVMWVGFESRELGNPLGPTALGYRGAISKGGTAKFTDNLTLGKVGLNYRF